MRNFSTTTRYALRVLAAVLFAVGAMSLAATGAGAAHTGTDGPEVTPELIPHQDDKNPTCVEYERSTQDWTEVKHDAPPANTTVSDSNVTIEISHATATSFSWELTSGKEKVGGIDAVLVKSGAQGHNLYRYDDPEADPNVGELLEDDGLISPDQQQGVSHISFCYDLGGGPTTTTTEEETTTTTEATTTTTEQETTTTTEATTTTTEQETTTTVEETTTTNEVQSTVTERETEVAGVQITQPAPAVAATQLARTGMSDWLAPMGIFLIAMGVAALRMSRTPKAARVIAR